MQKKKKIRHTGLWLLCFAACMLAACGSKGVTGQKDKAAQPSSGKTAQESSRADTETSLEGLQAADTETSLEGLRAADMETGTSTEGSQADTDNPDSPYGKTQKGKPEERFQEEMYTLTKVNLRKKASTKSKAIKVLAQGSVVLRSEEEGEWSRVMDEGGQKGYVYTEYLTDTRPEAPEKPATGGKRIVIDAGHQKHANNAKEPVGPGSSQMKAKVSGGTSGVSTGVPEYQLNLDVSMKLRDELAERGYEVLMVRESNDVDMSNAERAEVANNADADAFVRIHANGSENSGANGIMTICQTSANPYNAQFYDLSRRLSQEILDCMVAATGARKEYVWETDTMSGINWCQVPVTIVEMGYMSNPDEDVRLSQGDYQDKLVQGIADGIDRFFCE